MKSKKLCLIVGLGQTGMSFIRYAEKKQIPFVVWDTRKELPASVQIPDHITVMLGELEPTILMQVTEVWLSPGVDSKIPPLMALQERSVPIYSDLTLFARETRVPYVAITGSNGKTTVTTVLTEMIKAADLSARAIGNIGEPVLDCLEDHQDWFVIEVSSFQLETTHNFHPKVATVLNVSEDHMDRYATIKDYAAAKCRIYDGARILLYNRQDARTFPMNRENAWSFGSDVPNGDHEFGLLVEQEVTYLMRGQQKLLSAYAMPLRGRHHLENALACLAMGTAMGLPLVPMCQVLKTFTGLPHRCQLVCEYSGVLWFNDSKGTNVGATIAALDMVSQQIPGKVILLAGGVGKGADFTLLIESVTQHVRELIVFGESARQFERIFSQLLPVCRVKTLKDAVTQASLKALRGDAVLLSPACASFDMFKNYEDRGEQFVALCLTL